VPRLGLKAAGPRGRSFQQLGRRILDIAEGGLRARARLDGAGSNEVGFLDPLREIVASGRTQAERLLDRYHGEWGGDVARVYDEMSY
jgi:glutamate--cysteine ligase